MFFFKNFSENPFITKIIRYKKSFTSGKIQFSSSDIEIEKTLEKVLTQASTLGLLNVVKQELVYLNFEESPELKFSISIDEGNFKISRGWDSKQYPKVFLTLNRQKLNRFLTCLWPNQFTINAQYELFNYLSRSLVESFYNSDFVVNFKPVILLRLHKLVHLKLESPAQEKAHGFLKPTYLTVINTMGQFFIFEGLHGIAPIVLAMNLEQALELLILVRYQLPFAKSKIESAQLIRKFLDIRAKTYKKNSDFYNLKSS